VLGTDLHKFRGEVENSLSEVEGGRIGGGAGPYFLEDLAIPGKVLI